MSAPRRAPSLRAALLALLALGCSGAPAGETAGAEAQAVFGGRPAPDDTSVVAVVNFAGGQCSGSLIAPNLVLTARHCVADTQEKDVKVVCGETPFKAPDSAGAIFVVPLPTITENPDDYAAVAEIRMVADQDADLCGTDVALLRLKKPLDELTPLEPRVTQPVAAMETYSSVGYGLDESLTDMPSGERKRLDGLTVTCGGDSCRASDVRRNEWIGSGGPCPGDSGGPALDADGRVIGVVSRGKPGCGEPVFSDVSSRADWLQSEAILAAQAAHIEPPAWACDAQHDCATPADHPTDEPKETCSFAVPRPGGLVRHGWLAALLLLWRRGHRRLSIRPKRSL
jgi:V8-like Glu-specific endopeptidase